ncbi:CYTH and CHAD domain-containing protein [Specibacter cremeus]|uniref:CYTH and CHAD domain-containing protein n=1 Tax=Specibacter cremeus TaxID=1629051 RepID=UPI000F783092|nr:CYTH and CHAD domain-containing protein [Specibacter cremeus]
MVLETGKKFAVVESTTAPELLDIPGVDRTDGPTPGAFEAVYYDTPMMDLAARRIVLRCRTGGAHPGWQVKLPAGPDGTRKVHAAQGRPGTVPWVLADELLVHTRGHDLIPIATTTTLRNTRKIYGQDGVHLADFVDDLVSAQALQPAQPPVRWREWEIKLIHGTAGFFDDAGEALTQTGAHPSGHGSRLAQALGESWPRAHDTSVAIPRKDGPVSEVVIAYLGEQFNELVRLDPGVRQQLPDALHRFRAATHRIRSVLETYRKTFDNDAVKRLTAELKWLARILGKTRDTEVIRDRLDHARPDPEIASTILPIEQELGTLYNAGYELVLKALHSPRYFRLLDDLESFQDHPPTSPRASRPAREVSAGIVNRTVKELNHAHKALRRSARHNSHDAALHGVRKAARRLRHVAEAASTVHGKRATELARTAETIQKILGEHHDSVIAQSVLRRHIDDKTLPKGTKRAYLKLLAVEERRAAAAEADYFRVRRHLGKTRLKPR